MGGGEGSWGGEGSGGVRGEMLIFWFSDLQNSSDVKWVDGGKPIFKVSTNVLSTVYTQVSGLSVASGL